MTDSRQDAESTPSKPRGLWSLMGSPAVPSQPGVDEPGETKTTDAAPEADDKSAQAAKPSAAPEPTPQDEEPREAATRQRGLWGMMRQAPPDAPAKFEADGGPASEFPKAEFSPDAEGKEPRSSASRSLFALMERHDEPAKDSTLIEPELPDEVVTIRQSASLAPDDQADDWELVESPGENEVVEDEDSVEESEPSLTTEAIDPEELEPPRYRLAAAQTRRQGWLAITTGISSVSASALSLFPTVFASIPASVLGFGAIIAGYLSLTGTGRHEMSRGTRIAAVTGMLTGILGIFLGPLFFTNLGRSLREPVGHRITRLHLKQIGDGLDQHYSKIDGYPIGGVFTRDDTGVIRGQHGWMTFLLPYIGEGELYQKIDQTKPFDHPVNLSPLSQDVSQYFAQGADQSKVAKGLAAAHFAGVGGEISEGGRVAYLGIFERDVAVKRDEISDGLANTLIVGELGSSFPAWGEPENWREIGRGLNKKGVNGFGSADGNGAVFLLGDGSVKYFNNKTDPKLLEKMSTRNGAD